MKRKIIIASNNQHKIDEIRSILKDSEFEFVSMSEAGFDDDIPETGTTLEENALIKARFIYERTQTDCLADDSGLEVFAINNEPGVYSARYSGERDNQKNIDLVLSKMQEKVDRCARFRTLIALIISEKEYLFEGNIEGSITHSCIGTNGFGYDSIFLPQGSDRTFAEMTAEEKNTQSHRRMAVAQMADFLKKQD